MDVHPTKKVSIGTDPYPLRKPPTFWRLEVRSHLAFHEVATLPPKDLVRRAVVGRRIASRLRGMGKPWETVGNRGKDRKSRMWNSASKELRSECAWVSWCHPQKLQKKPVLFFYMNQTCSKEKCIPRVFAAASTKLSLIPGLGTSRARIPVLDPRTSQRSSLADPTSREQHSDVFKICWWFLKQLEIFWT